MTKQWDNWGEREKDRTKRERERERARNENRDREKKKSNYITDAGPIAAEKSWPDMLRWSSQSSSDSGQCQWPGTADRQTDKL